MVTPTSMSMPMSPYDAHKNFAILLGLNASCNGASYNLISRLRAASLPFGQPQRQLARACVARDAILMLRASQITEPPIVTMLLKRRKPTAKRIERNYDRKPDSIDAP